MMAAAAAGQACPVTCCNIRVRFVMLPPSWSNIVHQFCDVSWQTPLFGTERFGLSLYCIFFAR